MKAKRLREMLEYLHRELEKTKTVDASSQQLLGHVMRDIQEVLERSEDGSEGSHHSLIDRLREATRHFERSHPALTEAMGRVADSLSKLGI